MIEKALHAYTAAVETAFATSRHQARTKGGLLEFRSKDDEIRTTVDQLEDNPIFKDLVDQTRSAFRGDWHSSNSESCWRNAVSNFFRRAGYYTRAFTDTETSLTLLPRYEAAFLRRDMQTTYLAPLEFVDFPKPDLKFSNFQIRQISRNELDEIVGNEVNRIFYSYATVDTRALQNYWFLIVTTQEEVPRLGRIHFDFSSIGRISPEYTRFPSVIERILARLVLFDWVVEPGFPCGTQFGFNIPFVIRLDDNHLRSPSIAPDCSKLITDPQVDPYTEEEYEIRLVMFDLSEGNVTSFEECVGRADGLLRQLEVEPGHWPFLKVAIGNLIKAFFTDGLEQLLWHITAIEALLGERGKGVTDSLARRAAAILGTTKNERKDLLKDFKKLYGLRCDLVHGNQFKDAVEEKQLFTARTMARRVTIWFVHYLGELATRINEGSWQSDVPVREDFLALIDLRDADRERLRWLLSNLPVGFPTTPNWSQ